jgi:hypothetical protein
MVILLSGSQKWLLRTRSGNAALIPRWSLDWGSLGASLRVL